ncbi:hypothetical protein [Microcoleus sp.]
MSGSEIGRSCGRSTFRGSGKEIAMASDRAFTESGRQAPVERRV